ncbi:MAG: hypothetical protein E7295_07470 [Lachnospiraceae bacterium]|jgi:predicted transcriptional regulator|nr:hypothetical protein [Lachnospiraceae bacterium]
MSICLNEFAKLIIPYQTVRLLRQIQRKLCRGKTLSEIAAELEDTEDAIRPLYEAVKKYGADCTAEDIYEIMHEEGV